MIEKMYGPEVFYDDAANAHDLRSVLQKAYDECELELVSQPKIEITQLEKGKEFIFTAEVATNRK
jgi:trigger factor